MDATTRDLLLAQDGDDRAFARVVVSCDIHVRRFCLWLGSPTQDIDDLTQETFLRAFRGLQTYRGDSPAQSWLLSIARRVCLDDAEKSKKQLSLVSSLRSSRVFKEESDQSSELHQLISELPREFKEAFVLVRILDFSYDEAAHVLNCPMGTVQSRVARARAILAQQLTMVENRRIS